jgi:hypothetical protein
MLSFSGLFVATMLGFLLSAGVASPTHSAERDPHPGRRYAPATIEWLRIFLATPRPERRDQQTPEVFGTVPDTLEDVWVRTALGELGGAAPVSEAPARHPFDLRYAQDRPETAWGRCAEVLDHHDVLK